MKKKIQRRKYQAREARGGDQNEDYDEELLDEYSETSYSNDSSPEFQNQPHPYSKSKTIQVDKV